MTIKKLVLLLFILCSVSCDVSTPFVIDGQKEYTLLGKCGTIIIRGSSMMAPLPITIACTFNGKYQVKKDLFMIETDPYEIENLFFLVDMEDLIEKEIETKGGETLSISFNLKSSVPYQKSTNSILILPSDFITCDNKPIITDTIRIQLKN